MDSLRSPLTPDVRCGHSGIRWSARGRWGERAPRALQAPSHRRNGARTAEAGSGKPRSTWQAGSPRPTSCPGVRSSRLGGGFGTGHVTDASSQHGPRPREGSRTLWRSRAGAIVRAAGRSGRGPRPVSLFGHHCGPRGGHLHRAVFGFGSGINRHRRTNRNEAHREQERRWALCTYHRPSARTYST